MPDNDIQELIEELCQHDRKACRGSSICCHSSLLTRAALRLEAYRRAIANIAVSVGLPATSLPSEVSEKFLERITARDAEAEGLRTQLAEARKYGAPVAGAEPLAHVKNPCTKHNAYWTTASGACMACRADEAEGLREALRGLYNAVRGGDKTAGVTMDDALEDAKAALDAAGGA